MGKERADASLPALRAPQQPLLFVGDDDTVHGLMLVGVTLAMAGARWWLLGVAGMALMANAFLLRRVMLVEARSARRALVAAGPALRLVTSRAPQPESPSAGASGPPTELVAAGATALIGPTTTRAMARAATRALSA